MSEMMLFPVVPGRNYATHERAVRAADEFHKTFAWSNDIRYLIGAGVDKKGRTRFYPVFLPTEKQTPDAMSIVHLGFPIARM